MVDWQGLGYFLQATVSFFVISIACDVVAKIAGRFKLPLITIYLSFGVLCGPYVLDVVHAEYLKDLKFVNQFALATIAFMAGAELYFPEIRRLFRTIMKQMVGIVFFTVFLTMAVVGPLSPHVKIMYQYPVSCRLGISFLISTIMIARSPSSALALLHELHCKGPVTKTLLGVTVVSDVALLVAYAIAMSVTDGVCLAGGFDGLSALILIGTLLGCAVAGLLLGGLLLFYLWIPGIRSQVRGVLILLSGYGYFVFAEWLSKYSTENWDRNVNVEPLLVCMIASTLAGNRSHNRRKFANILHKSSPFIYVPFFTLTGAGLKLGAFQTSLFFALIVFFVRMIAIALGSFVAGKYFDQKKLKPKHYNYMWMTLTTQAGAALGLANEIEHHFPGWGPPFSSAVIVVVILNQIAGPLLFKYAMTKVGEVGKAIEPKSTKVGDVVLLGCSPLSVAVAKRLALYRCHVSIVPEEKLRDGKSSSKMQSPSKGNSKGFTFPLNGNDSNGDKTAVEKSNGVPTKDGGNKTVSGEKGPAESPELAATSPMHADGHSAEGLNTSLSPSKLARSESEAYVHDQLNNLLHFAARPRKHSDDVDFNMSETEAEGEVQFDPFEDANIDVSLSEHEVPDIFNPASSSLFIASQNVRIPSPRNHVVGGGSINSSESSSVNGGNSPRSVGKGDDEDPLKKHLLEDEQAYHFNNEDVLIDGQPLTEHERTLLRVTSVLVPAETAAVVLTLKDDLRNLRWAEYILALSTIRGRVQFPPRIVALVHDTSYVEQFIDLGVLIVYSPSAVAETIAQFTVTHSLDPVQIVPPNGLNVDDVAKLVFPEERHQVCTVRVQQSQTRFNAGEPDTGILRRRRVAEASSNKKETAPFFSMSPALRRFIPSASDMGSPLLRHRWSNASDNSSVAPAPIGAGSSWREVSVPMPSSSFSGDPERVQSSEYAPLPDGDAYDATTLSFGTSPNVRTKMHRQNTFSSLHLIGIADGTVHSDSDDEDHHAALRSTAHSDMLGLERTEEEARSMVRRRQRYEASTPTTTSAQAPHSRRQPSWYGQNTALRGIDTPPQAPRPRRSISAEGSDGGDISTSGPRLRLPPAPQLGASYDSMGMYHPLESPLAPNPQDMFSQDGRAQSPLFNKMSEDEKSDSDHHN